MAGNPLLALHVVALCMVALKSECLRDNDTEKLIAPKELGIALNSFIADGGFTAFADRVTTAHTKCQRLGMPHAAHLFEDVVFYRVLVQRHCELDDADRDLAKWCLDIRRNYATRT